MSATRVAALVAAAGILAAAALMVATRPRAKDEAAPAPRLAPASLFLSPAGSDKGRCTRAAPCRSVARAFEVAQPGEIAEAAAGRYGNQTLPATPIRAGKPVELRAAAGASVRVRKLRIEASGVRVRGLRARQIDVTDASNVAILGGSARGLWINNVSDLLVQDGAYGGKNDQTPVLIGGDPLSHRITFDRVDFHDAVATRSDTHQECLLANSPQGMTIRNSIFRNCAYFGALIATCCGSTAPPRDVLIENTVFERTYQWNRQPAPYSLLVSGITAANFTFRNNTFQTEPGFNETTWVNSRMVGNLGTLGSCQDNLTYAHNVWTTRTCGPTDTHAADALSHFADPARHDWRVRAGGPDAGARDHRVG